MDSRKPVARKGKRKQPSGDVYRDVVEHSGDLDEVIPELDEARTTDEQLELYRQTEERFAREGPA